MARFKRILLKLSGESLMGKQGHGIDPERLGDYARQIKEVSEMGVQIGIVIGGGNIFRGLSGAKKGFDRVKGDQMGMCATVINSLALSSALDAEGVKNKVLTAIRMEPIGEFYSKWKAIEAMEAGYVCIFSAGTGQPYFTTDTGSSLRGVEIEADVMLKGTRVDGVYTADPEKDPTATKFEEISYQEVLNRGLKVMDLSAVCMCQDNNLPIYVFNMDVVGNLKKVMDGEPIGTLVHPSCLDFLKLNVFAVVVAEDLLVGLALVDNRYTTARSRSAGSVFVCLLLCLLPASLRSSLLGLLWVFAALEIIVAKGVLFLLLLTFLVQLILILYGLAHLAYAFVSEIDNYQYDDSQSDETENNKADDEFYHNRLLVCYIFLGSDNG